MAAKPTTTLTVDADEIHLLLTAAQELVFSTDRRDHVTERLHQVIAKLKAAERDLGRS